MTREFPDELLSAYLDGELTAAEHQKVEARLAASETDRQLLADLRSLRGEVASLPRHQVDSNFADRVVRAALAAQVADVPPPLEVSLPASHSRARWIYAAAVLAAAASLLVAIQPWRSGSTTVPVVAVAPAQQLIDVLRSAAPSEGQALVVRLQVPAGAAGALDAALAQMGISSAAAGSVNAVADAYRQQVAERLAGTPSAAAAAVLLEAPLAEIERALAAVAETAPSGVNLLPEAKLDWARLAAASQGLGEFGSAATQPGQSLALRLDAGQFPLGTAVAPVAGLPTTPVTAGPVRAIILVEQLGAR
jgi:anti-sigma factor RsiW